VSIREANCVKSNIWRVMTGTAAALIALVTESQAAAESLAIEGGYGRANGRWGAEIGAGVPLDLGGFTLTPGGGVFLRDGGSAIYGRVEATYAIPASVTAGAGVRFSGGSTRPYVTLAMPLLPMASLKTNLAPKYFTAGLRLAF
jgi:hypothetical protein